MKKTKRALSVLLSLLMVLSTMVCAMTAVSFTADAAAWNGTFPTSAPSGWSASGTTYFISTPDALAYLMRTIANGTTYSGYTIKLTADIDLGGTGKNFTMGSGARDKSFKGTFDGQNYTISNMYISGSWDRVAMFMRTDGAVIKNVIYNNPKVVNSNITTAVIVGAAYSATTFNNVRINGTPSATANGSCNVNSTGSSAGGFVAWGSSNGSLSFTNCTNSASVYGGGNYVGGFQGYESSDNLVTFTNCTNSGYVTGSVEGEPGGIIGDTHGYLTMSNCSNSGRIYGKDEAGGLVGYVDDDTVKLTNCFNTGSVTSTALQAGGLVGKCNNTNSTITQCYNTGAIVGNKHSGGLVGFSDAKIIYTQCFNTGSVTTTGSSSCVAGGIAGRSDSSQFNYCYNGGYIKSTSDRAGGIFAYYDGDKPTVSHCYVYGGYSGSGSCGAFYTTDNCNYSTNYCLNTVNASPVGGTAVASSTLSAAAMPGVLGSTVYCQDTWGVNSNYPIHQWYRATLNFTVNFNANGGSCSTANVSGLYNTAKTLPTPNARTGYTFNGWYTAASGGTKIGNAGASITLGTTAPTNTSLTSTLYAQWTPNSSTLKVNPNGGTWNSSTSTQTFTQNYNTTKAIPNPARTGYTFSGWTRTNTYGTLSGTTYTFGATGNVTDTLTASWTINTSTLTVNPNGGTWDGATTTRSFTQNYATTKSISVPARTGYAFAGWTRTDSYGTMSSLTAAATYTYGSTAAVTDTITAKWTANSSNLKVNPNGGTWNSATETQTFTGTYTSTKTIAAPTKEGYTFAGWAIDGTNGTLSGTTYTFGATAGATDTLTASWTINQSTLTVDPNGGTWEGSSSSRPLTQNYGTTRVVAVPTREGYTFAGWTMTGSNGTMSSLNEAAVYTFGLGTAGVTLTANWTINRYLITFKNGDTVLQAGTYNYGKTPVYFMGTPVKESTNEYSYEFSGWSPEISAVTGDATYTAQFTETRIDYTVAVTNGEGIASVSGSGTYNYNAAATVSATASPNYTFLGWYNGDTCVSTSLIYTFNVTANVTLTAKAQINTYSVKFVNYNGDLLHATPSVGGETVGYPFPAPTRPDDGEFTYTFNEWRVAAEGEGACAISGNTISDITKDVILIANYTGSTRTYSVEYRNNNGDTICTVTNLPFGTSIAEAYTKADPVLPDAGGVSYEFAGWDRTVVTGNMTAVAQYRASNVTSYWVTFNDDNGETLYRSLVNAGGTASYPFAAPTKAADEEYIYTFSHWSGNITNIQANTAVSAVYTATANQYANCDHENFTTANTDADCIHPAKTVYTCSDCGYIWSVETSPALGHNWNDGEVTTPATCTVDGVKTYTCSRCDDTYTEAIPATGHTEETIPAVEPTCTATGLTEGTKCSVCDEILVAQVVIEELGHDWDDGVVITEASCTTEGEKLFTCLHEGCNETKTEVIPATGHTEEIDAAVPATCTETGLTAGSHCSVCDEVIVAQVETPALGHNWVETAVAAATCHTYSVTDYACSRCDETKSETGTEFDAANHDGETEVRDAVAETCGAAGYTGDTYCLGCNEIKTAGTVIAATGKHTWVETSTTAANCHSGKITAYECSVCNDTKEENDGIVDSTKHDGETELRNYAAATCTEDGYSGDTVCPGCEAVLEAGHVLTSANVPHTWVFDHEIAATCHTYHKTVNKCSVCDALDTITDGTELDASNHDGETEVRDALAATCAEAGYTGDTYCLGCNTKLATGTAIAATGEHTWVETSTVEATCHTYSVTDYKCSVCDETKTVTGTEYDAANHDGETEVRDALAATCGTDGYTGDTYCLGCDTKIASGEAIAATGEHAWEVTSTTAATCHSYAVTDYKCSVCDATKSETGTEYDAANHDGDTEVRDALAATCGTAGYTGDTYCLGCDTKIATGEVIAATGEHAWVETSTAAATCHSYSVTDYKCSVCDETKTVTGTEYDADNHDGDTEVRFAKEATCGAAGYTGNTYCKSCDAILVTGEAIPATGAHTWTETSTTPANCHEYSMTYCECAVCHKTKTIEGTKLDAANHDGKTEIRNAAAATCEADGYTGDTYCLGCGAKIKTGTAIPSGSGLHNWVETGATAATCHTYSATQYECSVCKETKTEYGTEYDFTNHDGETEIRNKKAATCGAEGNTGDTYCLGCNKMLTAGKVIPVTSRHKYVATVSTATCTEGGYTTYKCSVCSDTYTDEYTEATGHQWGNWTITKPAVSCVVSGIQSRTCAICGKIESDNYYLEHTPSAENPNTCSICGKTIDNSGTGDGSHGGETTGSCGCCDEHNHDKSTLWGWIQCLLCRFKQFINYWKNVKNF